MTEARFLIRYSEADMYSWVNGLKVVLSGVLALSGVFVLICSANAQTGRDSNSWSFTRPGAILPILTD